MADFFQFLVNVAAFVVMGVVVGIPCFYWGKMDAKMDAEQTNKNKKEARSWQRHI